MKKRVFLTGGTGFVGSNIGYKLLRLGYEVIFLVREAAGIAPEARLESVLKVIDTNFKLNQYSYQIMAGDICLPNLGLSAENLTWLKSNKPNFIFHCAGSISFSEREAEKTWKINVEGTRAVISFAHNVGITRLHHISTVYVVGASEGICGEKIGEYPNGHFNNPYERTKFQAEVEVAESRLDYSIYRPSIVIGNKQGVTLSFNGYYGYLVPFWKLKEKLLKNISKNSKLYLDAEIKLVNSDKLILPIAVKYFWKTTLNLIPVDWFAETMIKLSEKDLGVEHVFNLIHPCPLPIKEAIINSLNILGIQGIQFINPDANPQFNNRILKNIQRMVDSGIGDYTPYTTQKHMFDDFNTRAVLNSHYKPPPPIDKAFLERTLTYAIQRGFKR